MQACSLTLLRRRATLLLLPPLHPAYRPCDSVASYPVHLTSCSSYLSALHTHFYTHR